jgi:hypothetical protein
MKDRDAQKCIPAPENQAHKRKLMTHREAANAVTSNR